MKLSAESRPLADSLQEFLSRADMAVERAIHRIVTRAAPEALTGAYEASLAQILEPKKTDDSLRQVHSRQAKTLSPIQQRLRDLADKAQTVFNAQLVIVQKADD